MANHVIIYVLDQLIDNAVKYCNDEPVIKIWSCREEAQVLLYMEDNGDGICEISVDNTFRNWGPYGGLQLEVDWKSKTRKNCDITFRVLQLFYYSGLMRL